ncbi:MAG: hypothetical protein Q8O00_09245 [Holophaga sp.]|nr:hypothetical protein [Holophaga sp.]
MRFAVLLPLSLAASLVAQTAPKAAPKAAPKPAVTKVKEGPESQVTRQTLESVLNATNDAWFGKAYQDFNAVDIQGALTIQLSAAAMNAKVDQATQSLVKGGITQNGKATLQIKSTYFANADFKTEATGSFGNVIWYRVGNRGFLYSQTQNAYTTRVEPPPSDAPLSYLGWFRSVLNDIKAVYVDGPVFKATLGKEENLGGKTVQTLIFNAPTSPYDPKRREQSLADSMGFWKRGRLEILVDKATRLPHRMNYTNEGQGIRTRMDFVYDDKGHPLSVNFANQSKGMEGPGFLKLGYGSDGRFNQVSGELNGQDKKVSFDLNLNWSKGRKANSIQSVPPPTATKRSPEDLQIALMTGLAQNILELQRSGLNLRSVSLAPK